MTEEKRQSLHEVSHLLCKAYNQLVETGQVIFALHDVQIDKIDSIVKTVFSSYYEVDRFPNPQDKAAAFFCLIIKDHPVTDGNKRLATLWLEIYTEALGLKIDSPVSLDLLAVSVENEKEMDIHQLVGVIRQILF
jgi:prophage maintenance system killer protein